MRTVVLDRASHTSQPRQRKPVPAPVFLPAAATAIVALAARDCRWPLGDVDSPDFHFCGVPRHPGGSYCETHRRLARAGSAR